MTKISLLPIIQTGSIVLTILPDPIRWSKDAYEAGTAAAIVVKILGERFLEMMDSRAI